MVDAAGNTGKGLENGSDFATTSWPIAHFYVCFWWKGFLFPKQEVNLNL